MDSAAPYAQLHWKGKSMILCCGEALIDMIPAPTKEGGVGFVPHTGGSVFNTAIALGRLNAPVGMISGVSNDTFGVLLAEDLVANGVKTDHLIRSDRLTTLAIVHLKDGSATYSFYDENSAGRMLAQNDLPTVPDYVSTMFFGGISLAAEPAADSYAQLLARHTQDKVVMLDPNIRPGFITDESRFRTRLSDMIAGSDIVKLSDEDLHWWTRSDADLDAQARSVLNAGPSLVLVTCGADGVLAVGKNTTLKVAAEPATVVDTVGAGDTFNAGFLAALERANALSKTLISSLPDKTLHDALLLGARAAAVTVSRAGANPPTASELELT